jgi:fused signal recognition particle receptor
METTLLVLAIVLVVLLVGGGTLLVPRARRRAQAGPGRGPGAGGGDRGGGDRGQSGAATGTIVPPGPPPGQTAPQGLFDQALLSAPAAPPVPVIEKPPPSAGRMARLRGRLAKSEGVFGTALLNLLSAGKLDEDSWTEIEEILIGADMGAGPAMSMVGRLRTDVKVAGTRNLADVRAMLRADLLEQVNPALDRTLRVAPHGDRPAVVLMVGVNGTGKTTTCGRLARILVGDGKTVLLGAADTFRAAAADQLETWGGSAPAW